MIEPSHDIDRMRLYLMQDLERLCENGRMVQSRDRLLED